MYESPISVQQQFINDIEKETENAIMCRVRQILEIDIDEKELLAALRYERRQYDNGYRDGLRAADRHGHWAVDSEGIIYCTECGHSGAETDYCPECGARMDEPMGVRDDAENL